VCGRSAAQADLQELGSRLLSFYGQHEHRKLMLSAAQLELLDAFCGPGQLTARARLRAVHDRVRELQRRAGELRDLAGARDRELDLLRFELSEIEAAAPSEDEQAGLLSERDRLRHQDGLIRAAALGAETIAPETGDGVGALLARAAAELEQAAAIDATLAELAQRLQSLRYESEDVGAELHAYLAGFDGGAAGRLEEVEERLALLARLERKHGGSVADVLAHAERCRARRDELEHADSALEAVEAELAAARTELDGLAAALRRARRTAAPRLARAVTGRLAELAMAEARFAIELGAREGGCGPRGADAIEMLIAANGAGAPAPLREVASGGELSRVMLALLSVAHGAARDGEPAGPLLVFDEIDTGIGGHTARAVGEHLRRLSRGRQVLCITHLPQVAALADRHFTIVKDASVTPATTTVRTLDGDAIVGELVRMLGGGAGDRAAGEHARELLRAA
jgi:DNA repair protein RecN (Recombination protein N)